MLVSDVGVIPSNVPGLRMPGSHYGIFGLGQTASAPAHIPGAHMAYGNQELFGLGQEGTARPAVDYLEKAAQVAMFGGAGAMIVGGPRVSAIGAVALACGLGVVAVRRLQELISMARS